MIHRILIVGLGSIGTRHLRMARELNPGAQIRVLRRQADVAVPEPADGWCSSLEEAIEFAPQLSVIANPAPFHVSVALPLARAGSHLLIEKPLAVSAAEVLPLLELVDRARLTLLTGYNLRFVPSLDRFRRLLHEGIVGRVESVRCEVGQYLPDWRPGADYRLGVSARRELGGGALLELSHELDYLRWIFGDVQWVRALLCTQSALELDVEDCAHLILGFSGASSRSGPVATVNLDFIRHDPTRTCTVIGESGSLRWDGISGVVEHFSAGVKVWNNVFRHAPERDESYRAEWRHCMDCIESGQSPVVSGEDGLAVLDIIEAARRSAQAAGGQAAVTVSRKAYR